MWFFGLIVVLLIGAVAVVASGRWGAMNTAYDDRPDMTVPARQALTSTDIESARFAVGVRGYRMDEVDTLLERVAKEVAERDRRIADLERAVAPIVEAPDGHGFTSRPYDPTEFEDTGTQPPILVGGDFPAGDRADAPGSTSGTAGTDGPDGTAHEADSAGDADEAGGPAGAAGSGGAAPAPGETGGADEASGTPSSAAGAAGGADGPGGTAHAAGAAGNADGSGGSAPPAGGAGSADEPGGAASADGGAGGASGSGDAAHAAGGADEAGGTAGAGGSEDGPAGSASTAAGADGPRGTGGTPYAAGTAGPGGAAYAEEAGDADEPETSELPRASRAAADEYERLQAEARAVLEAQSQPVSPRRTPAPQQPAGESASLTPAQRYDQLVQNQRPAPSESAPAEPEPDSRTATHWTSQPPQQEQARDTQATEQAQQQTPQQQGEVEGSNGAAGDEEGWRFWPPADQAGEGAYHRPS
ncbi:DivIVA domain-containing protein [Kribbella sp. NPDC051936]|uniref:DivIVA domain-containing protein n=1 Tax=Kribbella sp. NPDC051936 TaxID=3154946 RepID=UPI003431D871